MMPVAHFRKAYRALNAEQKKAVDTIDGPVMVIAGPGTGKTQILTLRIANILSKTDTAPENILALTFTESGVVAMRNRLGEHIGSTAWRVPIHTFHSFSNAILRRHPDSFPRILGNDPITEPERVEVLQEILSTLTVAHLRPFNDSLYYLRTVSKALSDLKREEVRPDDLERLCRGEEQAFEAIEDLYHEKGVHRGKMKGKYEGIKKKLEKNRDLLAVYHAYEAALVKRRKYDFDDMILEVVAELRRNDALLREVAEGCLYILADEHQDANRAQNALLELLVSPLESPNLFVVGDEKQAIFRFQGATLDNFLYFKRKFPEAFVLALTDNYRSGQVILDAAHSLIEKAPSEETLRVPLIAKREKSLTRISVAGLQTSELERAYVASSIATKIQEGVAPENVAVIFRTNQEGERIRNSLLKEGVRAVLEADRDALRESHVRRLVAIIRLVASYGDDTLLPHVLHIPSLGFEPIDVYRFLGFAGKERLSLSSALSSRAFLKRAGILDVERFLAFHARLVKWHRDAASENLVLFVERLARESGILESALQSSGRDETLGALRSLLAGVADLLSRNHAATLLDVVAWISLHETHALPLRSDIPQGGSGKVRLMTAHKAKGLEFDSVYILGANDGAWGNKRETSHFYLPTVLGGAHDLDDERRLFYVALTRGKREVMISYARKNDEGKDLAPSIFLEEMDAKHVHRIDTESYEAGFDPALLFREVPLEEPLLEEKRYLVELFKTQGLAVTALNNYLECPWKYFYVNLLRVPRVQEKALLFGTSIHESLRYFFDTWRKGRDMGSKALCAQYVREVERLPLSETEVVDMKKRGQKALAGWHARYRNTWSKMGMSEFSITVHFAVEEQDIPLRGKLDRIDLDGTNAVVVDYKTGRPKSRGELEGRTKTGDLGYMRQLIFYKVLLNRFENGKYHMQEGVLDFVEPDARGKYHQERFAISEESVQNLEVDIARVATEILNLLFWNTRCPDKDCPYCRLRKSLAKA